MVTPLAQGVEDAAAADLLEAYDARITTTADSNHDQPLFPNLAPGLVPDGPDQIWVADITYVAIVGRFVGWR